MDEANEEQQEKGETRSKKSRIECLTPEKRGTSKHSPQELYNERGREDEKKRKRDLTELEHGWEELKLEREEMAKMA